MENTSRTKGCIASVIVLIVLLASVYSTFHRLFVRKSADLIMKSSWIAVTDITIIIRLAAITSTHCRVATGCLSTAVCSTIITEGCGTARMLRLSVVLLPLGLIIPFLPPYYAPIWVGGAPYYYANEVYYAQAPGGYMIGAPPAVQLARHLRAQLARYLRPQRRHSRRRRYSCILVRVRVRSNRRRIASSVTSGRRRSKV